MYVGTFGCEHPYVQLTQLQMQTFESCEREESVTEFVVWL